MAKLDWSDWANVAKIGAATGVVIALIFVGLELRSNTEATRAAMRGTIDQKDTEYPALRLNSSVAAAADSEESSIQDTYNAWVAASNERDIKKWSAFLAENPYFSPADAPPLTSTDEVIDYYRRSFADPWFSLDCEQEHVDISESGKMAWSRGICSGTFTGPDGQQASGKSRWIKVWIKQSDGSWRGRVNAWKYVDQP